MARQGFMIYHEDGKMLKYASQSEIASIVCALIDCSIGLEESGEIPQPKLDNGIVRALYDSMVQKIIRDDGHYTDVCRERAIARKIPYLLEQYKEAGTKISQSQARKLAERWYDETYTKVEKSNQMNSNCSEAKRSESVTPSETYSETLSPTVAVAEAQAEAVTPESQQVYDCVQNQGIPIKPAVQKLLDESIKNHGAGETIRAILQNPAFLNNLRTAAIRG